MNKKELKIQVEICKYLEKRKWTCMRTHGNMFQMGFPDIYSSHADYGPRWIEVKLPDMKGSTFTKAQSHYFPILVAHGTHIWVLTGADQVNYDLLFKPFNLGYYMDLQTGKKINAKARGIR